MRDTIVAIAKGAAAAASAAALTYLTHALAGADVGPFGMVLASLLSAVAVALHLNQPAPPAPPAPPPLPSILAFPVKPSAN